jgi:HEAT repeat protein
MAADRHRLQAVVDHYLAEWGSRGWAHAFHDLIELGPPAVPLLSRRLEESRDASFRGELVNIAGALRSDEALPLFARALRDPSPEVWKAGLDGLVRLATEGALGVLTEALAGSDGSAEFRDWAREALGQAREAHEEATRSAS